MFSLAHTPILVVKILSEPTEADFAVELPGKKDSHPTVVKVELIDTGEIGLLIANTIILSAFQKAVYPITGRYFKLAAGEMREGKKYRQIDVTEMEVE